MSDNPEQVAPQRTAPTRGYQGRPEKQRNLRIPNHWEGKPKSSPKVERPSPRAAPSKLPPPTRLHDTATVKVNEASPAEGSLFSAGISIREVTPRETFSPSAPALIDISRQTTAELITDDANLSKSILPEYLDYYSTAMLWLRILSLKQKNSQPLDTAEQDILQLIQTTPFVVPEPVFLQLRQLGNVLTSTKQHLYPEFPTLPQHVIEGNGGYYGILQPPAEGVDNSLHNLYEEIPCLGVTSEAVRAAISNANPGPYVSAITYMGQQPNRNLLGFRPLGARRQESKNIALDCDITELAFPCYPQNTGFNFRFLSAISNVLANTKTFKNAEVVFSTLTEIGAQSQTVLSCLTPGQGTSCLRGEQIVTSLCQESTSIYGSATFFNSQMMKVSGPGHEHGTWCIITPTQEIPVPPEWLLNRNERRDLPEPYLARMFTTVSQQAEAFRVNTIKTMVLTKR